MEFGKAIKNPAIFYNAKVLFSYKIQNNQSVKKIQGERKVWNLKMYLKNLIRKGSCF